MAKKAVAEWFLAKAPDADGILRVHHERCEACPPAGKRLLLGLRFSSDGRGALEAARGLDVVLLASVESCPECCRHHLYLVAPGEPGILHSEDCERCPPESRGAVPLGLHQHAGAAAAEAGRRGIGIARCDRCVPEGGGWDGREDAKSNEG